MKELTIQDLKVVKEFQRVPDEQLQWLISQGETVEVEEGGLLFDVGEPVTTSYVILDGKLRVASRRPGEQKELRILDPGQLAGYLPFSRATVTPAFCDALKRSWVFKCDSSKLKAGFADHYELIEAMVHMMLSRVREFTSIQQQNEKMFALGKLSAGLAHELNNPAAAISRAAALLRDQVNKLPPLFKSIAGLKIAPEELEHMSEMMIHKIVKEPVNLTMLQKADLEDELSDWLFENGLKDIDPEGLVERGFTTAELNLFKEASSLEELPVLLEGVSSILVANKMAEEIRVSSERISDLVGAVKNFTFMDKNTDRQLIDVHAGIRNTLTLLKFKLKKGNINVIEHYDDSVPKIRAFPGELNQVWTNIIDNAIDAMEANRKGTLEITSSHDARFVKISIKDDGTGIPENIKQNIFTPFFTTKEMGKGSGLGLDVVNRIMSQHNGDVKVKSEPGATEFEISFPI